MSEIFYKKQGRRYVPVSEYDNELLDAFPAGHHLVSVQPGGESRRYKIDPAYAPMIAAGLVAEEAISQGIMEATKLRLPNKRVPLTTEQIEAWTALAKSFGQEMYQLEWPSVREVAIEGVKAMQVEADKLMTNEGVRKAYEHFILMCKLAKESD